MLAPGGYLAVDLFFALSGFVLTRHYALGLNAGSSARAFLIKRAIRLYPLHMAGVVLFFLVLLPRSLREVPGHIPLPLLLTYFPLNLAMLPAPISPNVFPINGQAWTMFLEGAASITFALGLFRLPRFWLAWLTAAFALILIAAALNYPPEPPTSDRSVLEYGSRWLGFEIGAARMCFSFSAGILIARLPAMSVRLPSEISLVCCIITVAAMIVTVPAASRLAYDFAFIMALSPLLVFIGASVEPPEMLEIAGAWLGKISYAVYVVHTLTGSICFAAAHSFGLLGIDFLPIYLVVTVASAWLLTEMFDRPVRRYLTRHWLGADPEGSIRDEALT